MVDLKSEWSQTHLCACVRVCMRFSAHACVRTRVCACARVSLRACMRVYACAHLTDNGRLEVLVVPHPLVCVCVCIRVCA